MSYKKINYDDIDPDMDFEVIPINFHHLVINPDKRIYVVLEDENETQAGVEVNQYEASMISFVQKGLHQNSHINTIHQLFIKALQLNQIKVQEVIIESKDKTMSPMIKIVDKKGEALKTYNIPVGAHIVVNESAKIEPGQILVKIPRVTGKTGDITGGLPRVTELFEARNPGNPAVVSEIDGVVTMGAIKRGNREIIITSRDGEVKKYLCPLSKHILVQDNDFVRAGDPLSDGSISPGDILAIKGPSQVQEYLVNEVQEVYRLVKCLLGLLFHQW